MIINRDSERRGFRYTLAGKKYALVAGGIMVCSAVSALAAGGGFLHGSRSIPASMHEAASQSSGYSTLQMAASTANGSAVTASPNVSTSVLQSADSGAVTTSSLNRDGISGQRLIAKSASLTLRTKNVLQVEHIIATKVQRDGGFVSSLQQYGKATSPTVEMAVRVPQNQFEGFLSNGKSLGTVLNFSESGQDVTDKAQSLSAQLAQLQAERQAYLRLYAKAASMRDMLQIQKSLADTETSIREVSAVAAAVHRSVSFSTVSIELLPTAASVKSQPPVVSALLRPWHVLQDSVVFVITFVAWLIPWSVLAAILFLVYRLKTLPRRKSAK